MADQITDNRTLVNAADSVTGFVDLGGAGAGTLDTEIFYQGTGSIGQYLSNTLGGLMYDVGTPTNYSGNSFYFLVNCGIVGLLANKAAGGFRIRFTGASVTDWFEVYVAGGDEWPASFAGGWTLFVVDIDVARSTAITNGWTSGAVPLTSAIQRFGWAGQTAGTMPRMVDNTWLDALYVLPSNTPAIIVEGRNGGTVDWNFADVVAQMSAVASPVARFSDGGAIALSGPIQFGINDTTIHGFSDANRTILFDNQEYISDDLYKLTALGNIAGTTNVVFGNKSGTGSDAIGSQGVTIAAASAGARFDLDFNDPNLDLVGLYGCSIQHSRNLLLDDNAVETISTLLVDGLSCTLSTPTTTTGVFLKNSIINAATPNATAYITTETISIIEACSFQFSDGYAIELNSALGGSQSSVNNIFTGYGADDTDDAAIHYTPLANTLTINVNGGTAPTIDDRGSAAVTVVAAVTFTVTNVIDASEVRIVDTTPNPDVILAGVETVGTTPTGVDGVVVSADPNNPGRFRVAYSYNQADAPISARIVVMNLQYEHFSQNVTLGTADGELLVSQRFDRNYVNP